MYKKKKKKLYPVDIDAEARALVVELLDRRRRPAAELRTQ